jgi:tetratricopeptide (TPR) repeat protein
LGDIPDSEKYFEQAIDAYAGLHEKRNDALGAMAEIAEGAGQLNAALALHYRALDEARKATGGDLLGEANAQYGLGRVWEAKSGETSFDEAVKYYRQAVVTYKATSLEPRKSGPLAKNLLHIGVVARGINEYDFAIEAYDLAASFTKDATQENFKQDRARALAEIGAIRVAMNQTRRALASYQSALEIYRTLATDSLSVEDSKEDAEEEVERIDKIIKSLSKGGWKPPGAR